MPGMNSGINVNDPTVIAAFTSALVHQGLIALLIFAVLGLAWITVRAWLPALTGPGGEPAPDGGQVAATLPAVPLPEPGWRQLLRIGVGSLWVFDGILQAQPKMAIGLPSQVIQPIAASSPAWVQHAVNWAGTTWSYHPLQAGASAVWIQIGIGVWLLAASHGPLSRLAGLASVAWGLVVWAFGEAFGGIFAPGLTWLFGAPGAAGIYCVAGALIALPERRWHSPVIGRAVLAGTGLFLVGMAVLQAWPGRGFWQGTAHHGPGTLAGMTAAMAQTRQPGALAALIRAFTSFDEVHGFAVNLLVVTALAVIGVIFLTGRPRLVRPALIAFTLLCLADWVLIEDLGFLGGLGTDPNSMVPFIVLATAGYLALLPGAVTAPEAVLVPAPGWRERIRPASLRRSVAATSFRSVAAAGAVGLIILGAAPMAAAQANPNADPILAEAIAGSTASLNFPARPFSLTGQRGQRVSLAGLHGKAVLLTFLDPVCTTDCPLIAQEFRQAGQLMGAQSRKVELVAIVANPVYHQVADVQAFDRNEGLSQVPNWLFLTGTVPQLEKVWADYGIAAEILPAGGMIGHSEVAYVIDQRGHVREELNAAAGPGTAATKSSFAVLLADGLRQALRSA